MIPQIPNCMNSVRTLKIHQDGAAPRHKRPTSITRGQPLITRCARGYKRPTTEYNNNKSSPTTLKVMQWNANGLMRKTTELELQTTQPTNGGVVTTDTSCCVNCVEPFRPHQWGPDLPFLGMPPMWTRWMAGAAAHKSG